MNTKASRPWPGLFVVFEGIDGAGKTTQIQRLAEALPSYGLVPYITAEPSQGPYGKKLREKSFTKRSDPETELQLFLDDRRWHLEEEVKPALYRGEVVLQDRYYFSSMAYQGVLIRSPEEIRQLHLPFVIPPDLVFYLDLEPEIAIARIRSQRSSASQYEKLDYLKKVRAIFLKEVALFQRLDATQPPEELTPKMLGQILGCLRIKINPQ
ncbi:MAG: dTMP kinase [Planctomycetota bacterium]